MKSILLLTVMITMSVPSWAIEKCTDANGKVTYADFCPDAKPDEVEQIDVRDPYDPENARLTNEYSRQLGEVADQSAYDRDQRNARSRQADIPPSTSTPSYGTSRTSRTSRSGSSFDDQFSDALKSKIELQNRGGEVIDDPSYSDRHGNENQGQGSAANDEPPMKKYWDGYDDARDNLPDFSGDPNYQDGYDEARRAQEQEQRQKDIQRQILGE